MLVNPNKATRYGHVVLNQGKPVTEANAVTGPGFDMRPVRVTHVRVRNGYYVGNYEGTTLCSDLSMGYSSIWFKKEN